MSHNPQPLCQETNVIVTPTTPPSPPTPSTPPADSSIPTPTPAVVPPSLSTPSVNTPSVTTGGGMVYCSGPLAPGWNVSLPNGGCDHSVSSHDMILATSVPLSSLPRTGTNDALWGFIVSGILVYFLTRRTKRSSCCNARIVLRDYSSIASPYHACSNCLSKIKK